MRAERPLVSVILCALACACGPVARLTQPDGDGGWSRERRQEELQRIAADAAVDLTPDAARPPEAAAEGPLTLEAALRLAASRNRRIAEAERQLRISGAEVAEARGHLLPTTTGSGRYTWYTDPLTNRIDFPAGGGTPQAIAFRDKEFGTVNGTLTVPLDVWGEASHALASAQAGYRGERARLWATTLGEHLAVVRSYFQLLETQRLREVTEQTLALQHRQLSDAESRFTSGRLTKNELLVVQVALRNTEQELLQRDIAIERARWDLNQVVGLAVGAPSEVADVRTRPEVPVVEEALRTAYATNPVLVALVEEQQRLEEHLTALVRGRLPRLSAGAAIDYSSSELLRPQQVGSGFVGFTWDLGTDGRREAEIAAARHRAEQHRLTIEREMREIEVAVRTAQRATEERLAALTAAESAVVQAEENLRIRRQQFDAGRAASEDVLDAEALLSAQRATLAAALYQAHARRAELQRLMGLPLEPVVAEQR